MQISDIQKTKLDSLSDGVEVTFADDEGYDFMTVKLSNNDVWQLVEYAKRELSYAAQLKKKLIG